MSTEADDPTLEWETRFGAATWDVAKEWRELHETNPFDLIVLDDLLYDVSNHLLDMGFKAPEIRHALVRAYFQRDLHPRIPRSWFPR